MSIPEFSRYDPLFDFTEFWSNEEIMDEKTELKNSEPSITYSDFFRFSPKQSQNESNQIKTTFSFSESLPLKCEEIRKRKIHQIIEDPQQPNIKRIRQRAHELRKVLEGGKNEKITQIS